MMAILVKIFIILIIFVAFGTTLITEYANGMISLNTALFISSTGFIQTSMLVICFLKGEKVKLPYKLINKYLGVLFAGIIILLLIESLTN